MKRIVLCLDGTWNNNRAGSIFTNVCKLHQVVAPTDDSGVQQISLYVEGIVSAEGESLQFVKGGIGVGVAERVQQAYELLVKHYEAGDEIYLVGFSRGAFEARSLGGLITLVGIAKLGPLYSLDATWELYRAREKDRDQSALAHLREAAHYPVRIKCVAVWDTVGNLGNPFISGGAISRRYKFHDIRLSNNIDVALHALSIDEVRGPFRPNLWTVPKAEALPIGLHVEQVWFAGTHADVGGGHRETGLSDVSLLWMAERLQAKSGLALDMRKLAHMTRPDPLGPQHSVAQGWLFSWSGRLPFIRLIKQTVAAIPPLRRMFIGTWRSGKLAKSLETVNESIHGSVLERFGQRVIELHDGRSRTITYRPRNLTAAIPDAVIATSAKPASGEPRRVKIFTVHGTFAHDTDWDNWDSADDAAKAQRAFINRLAGHLKEQGVDLKQVDHSQYNWSGGNSHDERRVAAIGLKKFIQEELSKAEAEHGKDYYDKVFIVAHSHGGTISRLAMNLWDKDDAYYEPIKTAQLDELKHDDTCPTCMRMRHGTVGRNSVRRPDGVVTFGSPFVTFEQRWGGMLTAIIGVWVFRILALLPLLILLYILVQEGTVMQAAGAPPEPSSGFLRTSLILAFPVVLYWLLGVHLVQRLRALAERWLGKGDALLYVAGALQAFKYAVIAGVIVYYLVYATDTWDKAVQYLPILATISSYFWFLIPLVLLWMIIVTLPGRFLSWMREKVVTLRARLPRKYDPAEDRAVSYLSYHTPGDEAGFHLRVFGVLTWLVQTLGLAAAMVLAVGIFLTFAIGVETFNHYVLNGSWISKLGYSALQAEPPVLRDRFIEAMNWLTWFPAFIWHSVFGVSGFNLAEYGNARDFVSYIPGALVAAIALIFLLLMPLVLFLLAVAYVVSIRLRSSGLVFGSESFAWTMANRIGVKRNANDNTKLRLMFITPQAWRSQEMAHCYYYKSDRVISDVAGYMADWSRHAPSSLLSLGGYVSDTARWAVVALFVLTIFAVSVPIANKFAGGTGPSQAAPVEEKEEPRIVEEVLQVCAVYRPTVEVPQNAPAEATWAAARKAWDSNVGAKLGPEWADGNQAEYERSLNGTGPTGDRYAIVARLCKQRPITCQDQPHGRDATFELPADFDADLARDMTTAVVDSLTKRWQSEAVTKFGADWGDVDFNFGTMSMRRSFENACSYEEVAGSKRYHCKVAATACQKPAVSTSAPPPTRSGRTGN